MENFRNELQLAYNSLCTAEAALERAFAKSSNTVLTGFIASIHQGLVQKRESLGYIAFPAESSAPAAGGDS